MPRVTKKASDVTAVIPLARLLPEPTDFYRGRRPAHSRVPENVLLFHRTRAADLNRQSTARAFHQRYVLIVPLRGAGRVIANARALPLEPGSCVLIAPFQFHHYTSIACPEIDWLFVTFTYGNPPPADLRTSVCAVQTPFWRDLAELIRCFRNDTDARAADRVAWRLALVLDALEAPALPARQAVVPQDNLLLRVSALTSAHLREPLPIGQLAKQLGLSPSHLRQRFLQIAGMSLGRFQREYRLRCAAELLAAGTANVSEASAACGWDTPYAFSRAFRQYWGRAPKSFALANRPKR